MYGFCCPCTGRAALVMELIKGPSGGGMDLLKWAAARAHDRSVDTNKQRLSIASCVASGMAFLHDRGYIHADLKPGNVSGLLYCKYVGARKCVFTKVEF